MSADLIAPTTHGNLDEQISQLMQCKPLSETEVTLLLLASSSYFLGFHFVLDLSSIRISDLFGDMFLCI